MKKFFTALAYDVIFATILALILTASTCRAYAPEGKLVVTMLDVGQGDSILIETPKQNILVDAGDTSSGSVLVEKLQSRGIERLERIILTHPHADHIGGVSAVLANFPVDEISDNDKRSRSPAYKKYRSADAKFSTLKGGDVLDFGGGVKFKILFPEPLAHFDKINNQSVVGKLIFGDFSMLFTGDIEAEAEEFLLDSDLRATVLKSPHHGSKSSSTADFIANVQPEFVFISAGFNNNFGHPHKKTLKTYRECFILPQNILCTAFNGDIRVETDGFNKIITAENEINWSDDYLGADITVTRIF